MPGNGASDPTRYIASTPGSVSPDIWLAIERPAFGFSHEFLVQHYGVACRTWGSETVLPHLVGHDMKAAEFIRSGQEIDDCAIVATGGEGADE